MQDLFTEKGKAFLGGSLAGIVASIKLLFANDSVYLEFGIKVFGAGVIAFVSGLMTVLAQHIFKHNIEPRLKRKKNGKQKTDNDEKEKAA